ASARACSTVAPGFNRPPMVIHRADWDCSNSVGAVARDPDVNGTHRSGASTVVPWKPAGATPLTVKSSPLSTIDFPTIERSPAYWLIQNAWLSTTSRMGAIERSSFDGKNVPAAGVTPNTSK